jgi:hypothetical protein
VNADTGQDSDAEGGGRRGKLFAVALLLVVASLMCGVPAILSSDGLLRAIDWNDRGVELLRIPSESPTANEAGKSGYSVRALRTGLFGTGDTCVAIATWRSEGGSRGLKYRTWLAHGDTLSCRWPRIERGHGWLADRIAFPLPDGNLQHVFYAVVPDQAVRARITWVDGTSQEAETRTVEGRDGRFVALWKPGFGVAAKHSVGHQHARITLFDRHGKALDVY